MDEIDLLPWWDKYKNRESFDHRLGVFGLTGSKAYDEMWDFINEEVIPEVKKEAQEEMIEAMKTLIKTYEVEQQEEAS